MVSPIRYYIGVDGVAYRQLAPVTFATLYRAEGPIELCDKKPREYHGENAVRDLNRQLRANAYTAPKNGGYDKHDFSLRFMTGDTYAGRYDLKHASHGMADVLEHVRDALQFYAGESDRAKKLEAINPAGFAETRRTAKAMLARCYVGQRAQPIPAKWLERKTRALFLVRDYTKQPLQPHERGI